MTRVILSAAVLAAVLVAAAVPAVAHAETALPSLTGETFMQEAREGANGVALVGDCGAGTVTITYDITGTASGPYPGTFTETGTVTLELVTANTSVVTKDGGYYEYRYTQVDGSSSAVAADSAFSIDSPTGTVSGRRTAQDLDATCFDREETWTYDERSWQVGYPTHNEHDGGNAFGATNWAATITKDGVTRDAQGGSYFYLYGYTGTRSRTLDGTVEPEDEYGYEYLYSTFTETAAAETNEPAVVETNAPPVAGDIVHDTAPVALGSGTSITMPFSDPDADDTHTAVIDWGDGSTSAGIPTDRAVSDSHVYATPGVYALSVTVTDAAGASDTATSSGFVVVYDANGGSVSGGGHILSPEGAYAADPTATGTASFGFVSRYKNGAVVPTGNTQFQFRAGDLNFSSTSYEWLVVAGSRAQYKGRGTVNATGEYGFMLTAIDGSPDRFRIKIWNIADGATVYDNQVGESDTSDSTTALAGGSIVIHK